MRWPVWRRVPASSLVRPLLGVGLATLLLAILGSLVLTQQRASGSVRSASVPRAAVVAVGAPAVAQGAAVPAPVAGAAAAGGVASTLPTLPAGQMLIRSATIDLAATNPAALVDPVRQIAAAAVDGVEAGYVADERLQTSGTTFTATITIDVPATTFAQVMDQLRRLGTKVLNETSASQDVTEQYVDVDAQLQALRATQAQLLTLLGKAQSVADTLAVQRELTTVDTQINQLVGRENYLKSHSAYSTIVVTIEPPAAATSPAQPASWQPAQVLTGALHALGVVARDLADAAIWLLVFGLPLAAVVGLGIGIERLVVRRVRARV